MKTLPTTVALLLAVFLGSVSSAGARPLHDPNARISPLPCYRYAFADVIERQTKMWALFTSDTCGGDRVKFLEDANLRTIFPMGAWGDGINQATIAFLMSNGGGTDSYQFRFLNENGEESAKAFPGYGGLAFDTHGRMAYSALSNKADGSSTLSIVSEGAILFSMDIPAGVSPKGIWLTWFQDKILFSKPERDTAGKPTVFTLHILDVLTKQTHPLKQFPGGEEMQGVVPAVSVDGKLIFSDSENRFWTCDLAAASDGDSYFCDSLKKWALEGTQYLPSWTPDGRKVIFSYKSESKAYAAMANFDGSGFVQLTNETNPGYLALSLPFETPLMKKPDSSPIDLKSLTDPVDYERAPDLKKPESTGPLGSHPASGGQDINGNSGREDGSGGSVPSLPSGDQHPLPGLNVSLEDAATISKPAASYVKHSELGKENGLPRPGEDVGLQGTEDKPAPNEGSKTEDSTVYQATAPREPSNYSPHTEDRTTGAGDARLDKAAASLGANVPIKAPKAVDSGSPAWDGNWVKTPNPEATEKSDIVLTNAVRKRIEGAFSGIVVPSAPGGNPPALEGTSDPEGENRHDIEKVEIDPKNAVEEGTKNNPHGANVNPQ